MALDKNKYDFYQIKYFWKIEFYIKDSKATFRPKDLISVEKRMDYENNLYPIFKIEMRVDDKYFDLIYRNQKNIFCRIELVKNYYDSNNNLKPIKQELAMNDSFVVFWEKIPTPILKSEDLATKENINSESFNKTEKDNIGSISISKITAILWSASALKANKVTYNAIFEDCTVGDALGYIIDNNNFIESAIVDIPDNTGEYQEMVLLQYPFRNSIYSLQYRYGIYANGLWLFIDNNFLYCLKAYSINHQYKEKGSSFTSISLAQNINTVRFPYVMGINKDNKSHSYEANGVLNRQNIDLIMGELCGDSIVYTNIDLIMKSIEINDNNVTINPVYNSFDRQRISHEDTGVKIDMDYDELNNPYNLLAYNRKQLLNTVLTLDVKGVDIESFTPEKIVELEVSDDINKNLEFGGKYCIRNVLYIFAPNSSITDRFETTCIAHLTLSAVPNDIISN